jgi:hypothetical protein
MKKLKSNHGYPKVKRALRYKTNRSSLDTSGYRIQ